MRDAGGFILASVRDGASELHYHADARGNVRALTDESGAVVERYDYDAFGAVEVFGPDDEPRSVSAVGNNVLFAGAWFDAEVGLYLFGARWYDPATGRFLTREPVDAWANAEDFGNAYVYAANNPASYGDVTGYESHRANWMAMAGISEDNPFFDDSGRPRSTLEAAFRHGDNAERVIGAFNAFATILQTFTPIDQITALATGTDIWGKPASRWAAAAMLAAGPLVGAAVKGAKVAIRGGRAVVRGAKKGVKGAAKFVKKGVQAVRRGAIRRAALGIFSKKEWPIARGMEEKVRAELQRLRQFFQEHSPGRRIYREGEGPGGALGEIDPKRGDVYLYESGRGGIPAEFEELLHFKQLHERGLIGQTNEQIGREVIQELEDEMEDLMWQHGFDEFTGR